MSHRFVTNSLVLTVHEPNKTQSFFLLYHQRNKEEIMTYSCLEISVLYIVNSQKSRNSLHSYQLSHKIYIEIHTWLIVGNLFFPLRTHHWIWYLQDKRSTHCQYSWIRFQRWWLLCCWQSAVKINIWMKVLNALHLWRFTTEVKSPVYLTNSIYRYRDMDLSDAHNKLSDSPENAALFHQCSETFKWALRTQWQFLPDNLKAHMK